MRNLKNYAIATLCFVMFTSVFVFSLPQVGQSALTPPDKDVRVVNTTNEPVPVAVQGNPNVNVVNSPTVKAQQNGAWNVGITGTPTVSLDDSPTNPISVRDVDRPTAQPFQYETEVTLEEGEGGQNAAIPVPQGKLLVIEYVSVFGTAPASQRIQQFGLLTHVAPDNVMRPHYLQFTKQDTGFGSFEYTAAQQVRVYADTPGAAARVTRTPATGTVTFRFIVSGYFVNKN
jgi:hypothetical protein